MTTINYIKQHKLFTTLIIVIILTGIGSYMFFGEQIEKKITGFLRRVPQEAPEVIEPFKIPRGIEIVPGEVIVKFKPRVGEKAQDIWQNAQKFRTITGNDSLDNLISKYQVKDMERVFQGLEKTARKLPRIGKKGQETSKDWKKSARNFQGLENVRQGCPGPGTTPRA